MYTSIRDASYHVISKTLRKFRKIFSPKQIGHWTSFRISANFTSINLREQMFQISFRPCKTSNLSKSMNLNDNLKSMQCSEMQVK